MKNLLSFIWRKCASLTSSAVFYPYAWRLGWGLITLSILALIFGVWGGLWVVPEDYQQGNDYRILFIHAPSAWMSLSVYMTMAMMSVFFLIFKTTLSFRALKVSASFGFIFCFITLITGSLWGKPMWGTFWVWDARLTSQLILLLIYIGLLGLFSSTQRAFWLSTSQSPTSATHTIIAIVCLVGALNLPIIRYSVEWWQTLHQPASVNIAGKKTIDNAMIWPLVVNTIALQVFYFGWVLVRLVNEIEQSECHQKWFKPFISSFLKR